MRHFIPINRPNRCNFLSEIKSLHLELATQRRYSSQILVNMVPTTSTSQLLCLTMLGYKKPGLTEEELCDFQVSKHSQLVSGLMRKYGVIRYSIV